VAVAAALAGVDDAAEALARAGAAGVRAAAARLAGAAAILDAAGVGEEGAAGHAAPCPPGLRSGIEASLADIGPRAAVDALAVCAPGDPERRVAVDALARGAARAGGAGADPARRFGGLLASAWPRLTPAEQAAVAEAAPASVLGPAGVDPTAAAGARVVAAVLAGSPAGVAAAERALAAAAGAAPSPKARPAPSARVAAAACRLLLGDPDGAEVALGLTAAPPSDARIAEFVAARCPSDRLPGVCALAEDWLRGAARGSAGGGAGLDLSLATWFGRPGVAARLAAAEGAAGLASTARAAAGGLAGRVVGWVGAAVGRVHGGGGGGAGVEPASPAVPRPRPTAVAAATVAPSTPAPAAPATPTPTTPAVVDAAAAADRGDDAVGALQARLLVAAAAAGEPGAWADAPLPADAIVPVSGEAPLWAVEAPRTLPGWRGRAQKAGRAAMRGVSRATPVAGALLGAGLLVGAGLALPGVRSRLEAALGAGAGVAPVAMPADCGTTAAAATTTPSLSAPGALALFNRFQAARAAACGRGHAVSALGAVSAGKLLADETARAATLAADGWAIEYATRKAGLVGSGSGSAGSAAAVAVQPAKKGGGGSARFTVRAAEAATLRDGGGAVVDKVEWAEYTAVVRAETGSDGVWRLTEVREVE